MSRRAWALFVLMSVLWGLPYLLIKIAVTHVSVPVLVSARGLLGAAILLPLVLRGHRIPLLRRRWRPILALTLLEMVGPWGLLGHAETRLNSSTTGLLLATTPLIACVVAMAIAPDDRLSRGRLLGLLMGLGGVAVLAVPRFGGDATAIAEVLLTAVCWAVAPHIVTRWLSDVPPVVLTTACLAVTGLAVLPAAVATAPAKGIPPLAALAAIGGLAAVCTALAFVVFFALVREAGAVRTLVVTFISPAVAMAAGIVVLGEPFDMATIAALALIIGGSLLSTAGNPGTRGTAGSQLPLDTSPAVAVVSRPATDAATR